MTSYWLDKKAGVERGGCLLLNLLAGDRVDKHDY